MKQNTILWGAVGLAAGAGLIYWGLQQQTPTSAPVSQEGLLDLRKEAQSAEMDPMQTGPKEWLAIASAFEAAGSPTEAERYRRIAAARQAAELPQGSSTQDLLAIWQHANESATSSEDQISGWPSDILATVQEELEQRGQLPEGAPWGGIPPLLDGTTVEVPPASTTPLPGTSLPQLPGVSLPQLPGVSLPEQLEPDLDLPTVAEDAPQGYEYVVQTWEGLQLAPIDDPISHRARVVAFEEENLLLGSVDDDYYNNPPDDLVDDFNYLWAVNATDGPVETFTNSYALALELDEEGRHWDAHALRSEVLMLSHYTLDLELPPSHPELPLQG